VTARGRGYREVAFRRIWKFFGFVVAIIQGPHFFYEIRRIGTHAPFMTVGADFRFGEKVVEKDKFASEFVVVWRGAFGKKAQFWIAVALGQVAENLVVGAIFFNDVEDVFDRAWLARCERNRITLGARRRDLRGCGEWRASIRVGGVCFELFFEFRT